MSKNKDNYIVIMAGGVGSRFWPASRISRPKQFLDILNTGRTLIQSTYDRFESFIPKENIYIVTIGDYFKQIKEQIPHIDDKNIILEPERKNTAPCIGLACYKIGQLNSNAKILIAPADHIIIGEKKFEKTVLDSFKYVTNNNKLVTIGITPTKPSTGYGYIQFIESESTFKQVKTFTEKPDIDLAQTFISSGDFLWNAGIFVWSFNSFKKNFEKTMPDMASLFNTIVDSLNTHEEEKVIQNIYHRFNNISIDYGLMEKADNVSVVPADFEWSDLGTWSSIYELMDKDYLHNAVKGKQVKIFDSSNNLIISPDDKLTIIEGISDKFIIDTPDVLMILSSDKEQEVKNITTELKREKLDKYL